MGRLLERGTLDETPHEVERLYDDFLTSCRHADASALWILFTPQLQAQVDERARQAREQLGAGELEARFGYRGSAVGFDGTAYLSGALRSGAATNPCPDADLWRRRQHERDGESWILVAERPDGSRQALRMRQHRGSWRIDDLSKPRVPAFTDLSTPTQP